MSKKHAGNQTNNTDQRVERWMSPDYMADPMTGGYGRIPTDRWGFIVLIAGAVVPIIFCVVGVISIIVQETIDANKELHSQTTATTVASSDASKETPEATNDTPPRQTTAQSYASDDTEIEYETVELFDDMAIDIPKGSVKVASDEGVCYETPDGSLRVLVVRIPDPEGIYPENLFDYCEQRGIPLEGEVDPDGSVYFGAESVETDDDGNQINVKEEFSSYGQNDYRVRVESRDKDDEVSSHIICSLSKETDDK